MNHRVAWVAENQKGHLVPTPCYVQGRQPPDQAAQSHRLPSLALNASKDGASTISLDNLFQCITTLWVKNLFLLSNLNLPCLSLKPFPLVLSLAPPMGCSPSCLYAPLKYWKTTMRSPWSLLQAKQAQFPQPFLTGELLQPSGHLSDPPLDPLQQLSVFLILGAPYLDTVLQMGPHKSRIEGDNHLPLPAGHPFF